ncbi:DUF1365 domain-containing protein [Oleiagrimonas sp. C23AA]|uniref:DUF1365 domain-containing protein n=1 Tax=Oleiagrimonas sp. C23AA TaxID=2719047 RepID=UPI00141E404A|nr:DUF1365 domain-containing protein [Oleiagrimonas sp. C23AA]NII11717.1 DUF1365 domain-containing protein [Oleiagrimonas sp. C23AA]
MSAPLASAIYEGHVRHRRFVPREHAFDYRMAMLYLDLSELDRVFEHRWLWSVNRPNLAEFRRRDYMAPHDAPLDQVVRDRVAEVTGQHPRGPVRMLTHLRYFGHCFNPVTFYYVFDEADTQLDTIVTEITNTPWKERHAYVLPASAATRHGRALHFGFDKRFHVSPFMPMQRRYDWRFTPPGQSLHVHMNVFDHEHRDFDATLSLERRALDGAGLARVLTRYPAMTMKVVAAIHFEALRLFLKRSPVHDHPAKQANSRLKE